jgi:hypothetical protein
MWVMTVAGAFSAVVKPGSSETLVVRTRCEEDLKNLQDWVQSMGLPRPPAIFPNRNTDYPWRIEIDKQTWAEFLVSQTDDMDYGNFKSKIATVNPHHEHVYHDVWHALLKLEDEDDPKKMKAWKKKQKAEAKRFSRVVYSSPAGGGYGSLFTSPEIARDGELEPEIWDETRSMHDLTTDEWDKLMSEAPY